MQQAATGPPMPQAATQPPGRQAELPAETRPRRATRTPAKYVDFDIVEAIGSEISSSTEYGDNGLVGVYGHDKDDIGSEGRKEVTARAASLARTFKELPAAIMLGRDVQKDVKIIAEHMVNSSDISPVIIDDRDSFKTVIEIP